jgi:hypothetical protein
MKVEELHGFDLAPPEARRLQRELASRVVAGPVLDLSGVRHVADVSTRFSGRGRESPRGTSRWGMA